MWVYRVLCKPMPSVQIMIFVATLLVTAIGQADEPTQDQSEAALSTALDQDSALPDQTEPSLSQNGGLPPRRDRPLNRPSAIPSLPSLANRPLLPRTPRLKPPAPAHRKRPAEITEEMRTPDDLSKPYWEWEHATGDWAGFRPWLWEHGVIPELVYTGEVFGNVRGGLRRGAAYRGNMDVTLTLDTERLGFWPGGTLFIYWEDAHGEGIGERYVGAVQPLSNIDAEDFDRLSAYYYEQQLFDRRLRVKLGKQDANVDFAALDYAVYFLNSSFGLMPNVPMPTFPDPALGAAVFAKPHPLFSASAGLFDAQAGPFSLVELAFKPVFGSLAGTYRAGGWLHDADAEEITDGPNPAIFGSNYGFYLGFDQQLYPEAESEDQGLGAFFQLGWAPEDRNEIALYVGGGMTYSGPFSGRDADVAGIGVAHADLSERIEAIEGRTSETALEVFYRMQSMPWLALTSDIQRVFNPGGAGRDAWVLGARTEIAF